MNWQHTDSSKRDYDDAPAKEKKAFNKQVRLLAGNLHPSLRAKKYKVEGQDLWQARVSKGWRFYFKIEDDTYLITRIIPHPK